MKFMKKDKATSSISRREQFLGYLVGPLGYGLLSFFLSSYLNVYYTDVCQFGSLWGGSFMTIYPVAIKALSVVTFLVTGALIDRTRTRFGKARPWLLLSVPLLPVSAIAMFLIPTGNETMTVLAILGSNFLFYAVAATLYATANTLMVPLSSNDPAVRSRLAVTTNAQVIFSGSFISLIVPMLIIPAIGVDQARWIGIIIALGILTVPLLLLQFLTTKERVTDSPSQTDHSLSDQLRLCLKSHRWILLMIYFLILNIVNSLSNAAVFYYCNWVLGTYQDGYTQTLFYTLGNMPLGIGIFLCNPICKKLGQRNAICDGLLLAAAGLLICFLFPYSLPLVLIGQFIKACGTIPSSYLASMLLAGTLDDVETQSGQRCDGFSSSVYNAMITVSSGLAYSILNGGMAVFGYLAPTADLIPVQPSAVQYFFIFCEMGLPVFVYPLLARILWKQQGS